MKSRDLPPSDLTEPLSERGQAIFDGALQLPLQQRAAYVDQACANEPALCHQVKIMLDAHEKAGAFLDSPAAAKEAKTIAHSFPVTEKPGDKIGRYKLLQQLGEGGCGVVYMAEQEEPVRRRVALKVIKLGMDTKSVIARFEAERQALAIMDHPNIARVLDAGATETGRPFFVMELVRGIKITDYCDQNKLSTEDRLKLLIQVCHAIQHAHQKGIIHRDIKPSNILITLHDGVPVPKVIDFGRRVMIFEDFRAFGGASPASGANISSCWRTTTAPSSRPKNCPMVRKSVRQNDLSAASHSLSNQKADTKPPVLRNGNHLVARILTNDYEEALLRRVSLCLFPPRRETLL